MQSEAMYDHKNILFIVADDLNSWIEPLNRHPDVKTPNLNRLAKRSTVFSRAYCTAPYCNSSRMSVFTGCLPTTTGVYHNEPFWESPLRRPTFVEHVRRHGYYCFGAGKVFHGAFDYARANSQNAASAPWEEIENRAAVWDMFFPNDADPMPPERPLNRMFDFSDLKSVGPWNHHFDWGVLPEDREPEMPDSRTVEHVVQFLKNPPRKPFFCAAGFYKPHLPWYIPQRFRELYPLETVTLPFVRDDDLDDVPDIARKWATDPPDHETVLKHGQWRHAVQGYLAAISYVDAQIGQLLDALDASAAAQDTIVAVWGDNGFHLGEKLHWRKFVLWEEATRIPLIIAPAGSSPTSSAVHSPVSLVDLWPTLCDLAGIPLLSGTDGFSLRQFMDASSSADRERPVVTTWLKGNHSLRTGHWRYTRYGDGTEELYNHELDPYEWTNLASDPRNGAAKDHLSGLLNTDLARSSDDKEIPKVRFFDRYDIFLRSSPVGNWPDRLNARYRAIIEENRSSFVGARVLDIASHDGRWSFAALDAGASKVVGIEARPDLVQAAAENMEALGADKDRYEFRSGDMFGDATLFQQEFDVVLCLGIFYHTMRHVELLDLINRTNAKTLILDTMVTPADEPIIEVKLEGIASPANGTDHMSVRNDQIPVGYPSPAAVEILLHHFGFDVRRIDWDGLLTALDIKADRSAMQSAGNPVGDYARGQRATFIATRR